MDNKYYWKKPLTLHELMEEIENLDESYDIPDTISIFPPSDGYETDEDSGDEAKVDINNLPGNQLRAEAEVSFENNDILSADGYDREDELPLSSFLQPKHQKLLFETSTFKKSKPTFTWKKTDINACLSTWQEKQGSKNTLSPIDLFFLFVDDEIIDLIRNFTNLYASQHNRSGDVSTEEIKCFIGILLLSGYYKFPRRAMYWENAEDAGSKLVYEAMSRDRFSFIMQNLHCNDNTKLTKDDKFTKLRPLFDTLNKKFQAFAPFQEFHSLDESMVPYYGGHGTKQFIRGKPIRWGYKFWTGTTRNGYVEWFEPYQGSGTQLPKKYHHLGLGASVVLQARKKRHKMYGHNERKSTSKLPSKKL
ncbi:piggyBac transposable element-derived protein 3-like [Harmonia axyridis]|uniref:piggyBac transposable element-derived protein 3-like n=1 Tax=Harmonia axyridis TaxID=115357 RepID=UPI001E278D42|nr:piggyBac transposable element-derived protein 3-like [Harmonia axyridis]